MSYLFTVQCQQLIDMLSNQLPSSTSNSSIEVIQIGPSMSNLFGNNTFISYSCQIIDIRATHHVYFNLSLFASSTTIHNANVTRLNGVTIPILRIGIFNLSTHIQLHNVLFVPHFKFNLLSVSSFTKSLPYSLLFSHDSCATQQDQAQGKVIGMSRRR